MKNLQSRHSVAKAEGFTLIELLVVVLIIGILAAIALPQYTKAVEKSRAAEMFITIKTMGDAFQRYRLSTGSVADVKTTDIIDIDLSGGTWDSSGNIYTTKNFKYVFYCSSTCGIDVERIRGTEALYELELQDMSNPAQDRYCYTNDNSTGKMICKIAESSLSTETVEGVR
ncbi:prepilin-type N-terminal cleavage/methylation domain-containing protein [Elusimicrobium posterum]|uniref:type IV pilin protein n=1 Tax=Elusimicrobium posterum TaxID=3116653 RepID=UPI003C7642C1